MSKNWKTIWIFQKLSTLPLCHVWCEWHEEENGRNRFFKCLVFFSSSAPVIKSLCYFFERRFEITDSRWTKSCTSWDVRNTVSDGKFTLLTSEGLSPSRQRVAARGGGWHTFYFKMTSQWSKCLLLSDVTILIGMYSLLVSSFSGCTLQSNSDHYANLSRRSSFPILFEPLSDWHETARIYVCRNSKARWRWHGVGRWWKLVAMLLWRWQRQEDSGENTVRERMECK